MGNIVREFITHREPDEHIWVERDEEDLIGTVRAGQRPIPRLSVFDLLPESAAVGASSALVWEGETLRIAAEQVRGTEAQFTRAADYDVIYFQFCGGSVIESEYGAVGLEPGEVVLLPAAISHRSTGKGECLRLRVMVKDAVELGVDPEKPLTERRFKVIYSEPLPSANGDGAEGDRSLEHTSFWEPASDIWIERRTARLIGCVKEGGRGLKKIRAFDYFTGMTGKGGAKAPVLYHSREFRIDVYNLEGQQRGFHRGCDEDEIWFQFRGHAVNDTEWGIVELDPGEMSFIPRGISHRINGGAGFLRMVFYSRKPVFPKAFNSLPGRRTSFKVE